MDIDKVTHVLYSWFCAWPVSLFLFLSFFVFVWGVFQVSIPFRRKKASDKDKEDDDDDDSDTEPMDIDDDDSENPASSSGSSSNSSNSDDDNDASNSLRRPSRAKPKQTQQKLSFTTITTTKTTAPVTARRSSRATRFTSSMKEPTSDSVRDLFAGATIKARLDSSDDDDDDDDEVEEIVPRRQQRRPPSSQSASYTKSPARRHTRVRRSVIKEETSDEEESEGSEIEYEEDDENEEERLKIQKILACRTETRAKWKQIGKKMNSTEVTDGSRWFQDEVDEDDTIMEERFLVKWADLGYMHVSWETQEDLSDQTEGSKTYLSTFFRKSQNGILFSQDDRKDGDYFDPGFVQIDRILEIFYEDPRKIPTTPEGEEASKPSDFGIIMDKDDEGYEDGTGRQFLVKWVGMSYSDSTFEFERDMIIGDVEYKEKLKEYYLRNKRPNKTEQKKIRMDADQAMRRGYKLFGDNTDMKEEARETEVKAYQKQLAGYVFENGGQLRDYQAEGVTWFLSNYVNQRSCILADEMGLGKVR